MRKGTFEIRKWLYSNSWFHQEIPDQRRRFPTGSKHNSSVRLLPTYISKLYDGGKREELEL
jgi:hypothetical protein